MKLSIYFATDKVLFLMFAAYQFLYRQQTGFSQTFTVKGGLQPRVNQIVRSVDFFYFFLAFWLEHSLKLLPIEVY